MITPPDTSFDEVLNHPSWQNWKFDFLLVQPNNLTNIIGKIDNVDISSVTITESYYTDTRTQARLEYYGEISNRQAYVKIVATETNSGYTKTLGVFIPTSDNAIMENGIKKTTLNLESILYGIAQNVFETDWVCEKGSSAQDAMGNILVNKCSITPYNWFMFLLGDDSESDIPPLGNAKTYFPNNYVIDASTSVLQGLFAIANTCDCRIGVTNTGYVYWTPYVAPSDRTLSFTIDVSSSDSITIDGISRSSNYLSMASKIVVRAKEGGTTVCAIAYYSGDSRLSLANRGYYVAKFYDLESVTPFTSERVKQIASEYRSRTGKRNIEWELTTSFMPIHAGDVGTLRGTQDAPYSSPRKVLVKNKEINLSTMTQKLTLKIATSNDTENGD